MQGMSPAPAPLALLTLWSLLRLCAAPSCEEARLRCAYRTGCGQALHNYLLGCSGLLHGNSGEPSGNSGTAGGRGHHCPEPCQHALIALTSAEEGKDLMSCECADDFCEESKRRVEVCRPDVESALHANSVLSCRAAQAVCKADALCATALDYYRRLCRPMFRGRRCSLRCNNSIAILRRQDKAAKLATCRCDGTEDYHCVHIRDNMRRLCFTAPPPAPVSATGPTLTPTPTPAPHSSAAPTAPAFVLTLLGLVVATAMLHVT